MILTTFTLLTVLTAPSREEREAERASRRRDQSLQSVEHAAEPKRCTTESRLAMCRTAAKNLRRNLEEVDASARSDSRYLAAQKTLAEWEARVHSMSRAEQEEKEKYKREGQERLLAGEQAKKLNALARANQPALKALSELECGPNLADSISQGKKVDPAFVSVCTAELVKSNVSGGDAYLCDAIKNIDAFLAKRMGDLLKRDDERASRESLKQIENLEEGNLGWATAFEDDGLPWTEEKRFKGCFRVAGVAWPANPYPATAALKSRATATLRKLSGERIKLMPRPELLPMAKRFAAAYSLKLVEFGTSSVAWFLADGLFDFHIILGTGDFAFELLACFFELAHALAQTPCEFGNFF
jgi:hypothetical protein